MSLVDILHSEATLTISDLKYVGLGAAVFALYRVIIEKFFLKPISAKVPAKNRFKFVHRGFDCLHYWTSAILGTLAFSQRPYAHCPFWFADCVPYIACTNPNLVCTVFEKLYYLYFASYYISDVLWLWTSKGLGILVFHHVVTISMILITVVSARSTVGLSIMILHDWVDVFLYTGKITSYMAMEKLSDISFVTFAIAFFYLRLFNFAILIYTIWFRDPSIQTHHANWYTLGRVLTLGLYCCHIIWGSQIVKAVIKIFKGDKIHDTRSDDPATKKLQ